MSLSCPAVADVRQVSLAPIRYLTGTRYVHSIYSFLSLSEMTPKSGCQTEGLYGLIAGQRDLAVAGCSVVGTVIGSIQKCQLYKNCQFEKFPFNVATTTLNNYLNSLYTLIVLNLNTYRR